MCGMTLGESGFVVSTVPQNSAGIFVWSRLPKGWISAASFDYRQFIQKFGTRINHIHLKDVRADVMATVRSQDLSFNRGVRSGMFTIPGDGVVDFTPVFQFIAQSGYSGWLVVEAEQDPNLEPPAKTVARAFNYLSDITAPR